MKEQYEIEIIAKVGKRSRLKFNSKVNAHRAVTVSSLRTIANDNKNCNIVIIESVTNDEYDDAVNFIQEYESGNRQILFFIDANDEVTRGLADELDYTIITSDKDLYKIVSQSAGFDVSMDFIKRFTNKDAESFEPEENDVDDDTNYEMPNAISESDYEDSIDTEKIDEIQAVNNEEINNIATGMFDIAGVLADFGDKSDDEEDEKPKKEEPKQVKDDDINKEKSTDNSSTYVNNERELSAEDLDELNKTRIELADIKYKYNELLKDMKSQSGKLDELEKIKEIILREHDDTIAQFNDLFEAGEVIEDPISLQQYQELLDKVADSEKKELDYIDKIDELNATLSVKAEELKQKSETIDDLNESIVKLTKSLSEINSSVETGAIHKDIVEQFNKQIGEITKDRDKIQSQLDTLKAELEKEKSSNDLLLTNLREERSYREKTIEIIQSAYKTFALRNAEFSNSQVKIDDLESKLADAEAKIEGYEIGESISKKSIEELNSAIGSLKSNVTTLNEELETAKKKNKDLDDQIKNCNNTISSLTSKLSNTESDLKSAKDELKEAESKLKSASSEITSLQSNNKEIERLSNELSDLKKQLNEAKVALDDAEGKLKVNDAESEITNAALTTSKETIEKLTSKVKQLKEDIKKHQGTIDEKQKEIDTLKEKVESLEKQLDNTKSGYELKIKDTVSEYESKIDKLNSDFEAAIDGLTVENNSELEKRDKAIKEKDATIDKQNFEIGIQKATITKLEDSDKSKQDEIDRLNKKVKSTEDRYEGILESLKSRVSSINVDINSEAKIGELETTVEKLKKENSSLKSENGTLSAKLGTANEQLDQPQNKITMRNDKIDTMSNDTQSIDETSYLEKISTLENKVQILTEKNGSLSKSMAEYKDIDKKVAKLEATIESQRETIGSMASNVNMMGGLNNSLSVKPIDYHGRAQIITIFGSGSYGITTTAISLARRLSSSNRVLFMDFDMCTPSIDRWFQKSPSIPNVQCQLNRDDLRRTSLSLFYEFGDKFIKQHIGELLLNRAASKGGYIDMFSGCYVRPTTNQISSANYSLLFNLLEGLYDYIIIDAGRLGSTEVNDDLIKQLTDISIGSVAVTTENHFCIRDFHSKIVRAKLDINKVYWVINQMKNVETGMSDVVIRKLVQLKVDTDKKVVGFVEDHELRSQINCDLLRDRMNAPKVDGLLAYIMNNR